MGIIRADVTRIEQLMMTPGSNTKVNPYPRTWTIGGTVDSKSTLIYGGILLSRVPAPPPAPWPDGGAESLRSLC
ncbi:hypothetical protein PoB_000236200 [Plakobranchus ocellatus]|uniref:Uncharacterized protein n=1 Tax=Plakobranchus ocellatus TaxID=259542 RepID=A0AAV3XZE1_9GAST|nr:hypothetical protein PoB_000236200 [Plakobranchus ocellatus]